MHDPHAVIAARASTQHGTVARWQFSAEEVPDHWLEYRLTRRRMRQIHRGVYGVGPVPTQYEPEMAAILACGPGAALSHRSAGAVRLLVPALAGAPVDVTVEGGGRARRRGIRIHRTRNLEGETEVLHGLRITTTARTLLDLAAVLPAPELERCVAQALRSGMVTRQDLEATVRRHRHRQGTRALRLLVEQEAEPSFTRSEAERVALALFRAAGLRTPEVNQIIEGWEVDFVWRTERVIVEIDGYAYHSSRLDFERDRLRDATLTAAGYRVLRVTWRQLTRQREFVGAQVAGSLALATAGLGAEAGGPNAGRRGGRRGRG